MCNLEADCDDGSDESPPFCPDDALPRVTSPPATLLAWRCTDAPGYADVDSTSCASYEAQGWCIDGTYVECPRT